MLFRKIEHDGEIVFQVFRAHVRNRAPVVKDQRCACNLGRAASWRWSGRHVADADLQMLPQAEVLLPAAIDLEHDGLRAKLQSRDLNRIALAGSGAIESQGVIQILHVKGLADRNLETMLAARKRLHRLCEFAIDVTYKKQARFGLQGLRRMGRILYGRVTLGDAIKFCGICRRTGWTQRENYRIPVTNTRGRRTKSGQTRNIRAQ